VTTTKVETVGRMVGVRSVKAQAVAKFFYYYFPFQWLKPDAVIKATLLLPRPLLGPHLCIELLHVGVVSTVVLCTEYCTSVPLGVPTKR
jgi:hypothetical protein